MSTERKEGRSRSPRLARWMLRLVPLGDRRAETEADLLELFSNRLQSQGVWTARLRYLHDILSLFWRVVPGVFDGVSRDLVFAARLFGRRPAIVTITILGLGLGIGVSTAVFSLMNAALLRSAGIEDPARVVKVMRVAGNSTSTAWRYSEFLPLQASAHSVALESWLGDGVRLGRDGSDDESPIVKVAFVTPGYLKTMGAKTSAGRLLGPADEQDATEPVIVITHAMWMRRFGGDPTIVGRTIDVGRTTATIVGVVERGFSAPADHTTAFWAPFSSYHRIYGGRPLGPATDLGVHVVGRLGTTVTKQQAEQEMTAAAKALPPAGEPDTRPTGARLDGTGFLNRAQSGKIIAVIVSVSVVIGLVLLLACVNVANLLLATALTRDREIGVRLALGATRPRLVRQLLTESLALGVAGGALGLAVAHWLVPFIATVVRAPEGLDVAPDRNVYFFVAAITTLAGLGAGLAPARHGMSGDLLSPLKGNTASAGASRPKRTRGLLIGVQSAASVLLLVLSTLLVRATIRATQVDIGFDPSRLLAVSVGFGRNDVYEKIPRLQAYWAAALDRIRALPETEAVTLTTYPPFGGASEVTSFTRNGSRYVVMINRTPADYFDMIGLQILRGRGYTAAEVATDAPVAVISETLARDFWGIEDPVGSTLDRITNGPSTTVIGVARDVITWRLRDLNAATLYYPMGPRREFFARIIVRTRPGAAGADRQIREALRQIDPALGITVTSVNDGFQQQLDEPRILAGLSGALAVLAILLAVIGLYGVTAAVVGQRTREIGLRLAIGAGRRDVMRLLMLDSMRPVLIGLTVGVALALLSGRVIAGVLYGVPPHDPQAFLAAIVLLIAASLGAVAAPVWRASRVDPAFVLRQS